MRAVMLAAGIGSRLADGGEGLPPKSLLRFGGKSLIERHLEILRAREIAGLTLVVGYRSDEIREEIARLGADAFVTSVVNPDFREGSVVSMAHAGEALSSGDDILFMDADVLYEPDLIDRLLGSAHADCVLLDREFEDGDEPVRVCLRDGEIAEFRKAADGEYDLVGEWPGFLRLSPSAARILADTARGYAEGGRRDQPYEEALREVFLSDAAPRFGFEDITGLAWIEIDFPADRERAERVILPRVEKALL